jgi:hypothetical protein
MSARFLAWYTCGILSVACVLSQFVSVVPAAEARWMALEATLAGMASAFAGLAVLLTRLPTGHWCHRSIVVRCFLFTAALSSTMLLAASVG